MGVWVSESNRSMSPEHSETNHAAIYPIALRTRSIVASIESPSAEQGSPWGSSRARRARTLCESRGATTKSARSFPNSLHHMPRDPCTDRIDAGRQWLRFVFRSIGRTQSIDLRVRPRDRGPGKEDSGPRAARRKLPGRDPAPLSWTAPPDDCCCRCLWFPFLVHVKRHLPPPPVCF